MINYNNFSKITKFLMNKILVIKLKFKNVLQNQFKNILLKRKNHNLLIRNRKGHSHLRWLKMTSCRSIKLLSKRLSENLIVCNRMMLSIMIKILAATLDVGWRVKHRPRLWYQVFKNRIKKLKLRRLLTKMVGHQ